MTWLRCAALLCLPLLLSTPVSAEDYPSKLITMIVPFAAGSGSDTAARIVAQALGPRLGQNIIVENKVGATGEVAATLVARSAPNGYTLLVASNSTQGSNSAVYKTLTYDPIKDFEAIAPLGLFTYYLVVNPQLPIHTPQELAAYVKANPGKVTYATGSTTSLVMAETFAKATGTGLVKVSYRSNPPAITDVISGRVAMMFVDISTARPFVNSGQLRPIAITSHVRSKLAPELPTIQDTVAPDFAIESWVGFLAPAGTPPAIIDTLNKNITAVMMQPEVRDRMAALGVDVVTQTPADFSKFVANSVETFTSMTKAAGIEPQ